MTANQSTLYQALYRGSKLACPPPMNAVAGAVRAALLGLAIGSIVMPQAALAQVSTSALPSGSNSRNFQVPAGPLDRALDRFARLAGVNLSYDAAAVSGRTTPGLNGNFSVAGGLAALLAGSGLQAAPQPGGGYQLTKAPPAPEQSSERKTEPKAATLPEVRVSAPAYAEPDRSVTAGLLPLRPSLGVSRLSADIREQANVIHVVPRQSIEDRAALSVHEAIETVAGVRPVSPAYTSRSGGVRVRGFESFDSFINGFRFSGFGIPVASANIESVEVLKGPASIQYGLTEPGGAMNIVTKRPVAKHFVETRLRAGSYSTYRADIDTGGALDSDGRVLTRLNLSAEENEEHRDFDKNRNFSVSPAISWLVSDRATVDLELNYLHNRYRFNRGLPPRSFILDLPMERSMGDPNQPLSTNKTLNLFYTLNYKLGNGDWAFRQRAGYQRTDSDSYDINAGVRDIDAAGNLTRSYITSFQEERSWAVQHELVGGFDAGGWSHKAMVGFEFGDTGRAYGFNQVANPAQEIPALNVFNPVYGNYAFPGPASMVPSYPAETYGNRFQALYADWQTKFSPQWRVLAGLRLDETSGYYRALNGTNYGAADSKGVSPRLGVVWTPLPQLDIFANYSTGFQPNLFADAAGNLFTTPEKSAQIEAGLRYEFIPGQLRGTVSVYSIKKKNVQTPDLNDPTGNRSVLTGEQQSDGMELELVGALNRQWDVSLGYAYMDARTTRDNNAANVGVPLVDTPRHHFTSWVKYKPAGELGWWFGYGLTWADDRRSSSANPNFLLPSYARHDLAVGYKSGPWSAQVNLGNLSNERIYYTHGNNIHLQPGRNFRVSASYRF